MILTQADLQDWNSSSVTKEIFKRIQEAKEELSQSSPIRDTSDQTAMQASRDDGIKAGMDAIHDAFFELEEEVD
mgnify:CR=1 FL=1|tara:strand:- start:2209 stop:2430 length:222 start_codon:yes stop_codon:yes gene_type:complete